jgi:hypothetical protein
MHGSIMSWVWTLCLELIYLLTGRAMRGQVPGFPPTLVNTTEYSGAGAPTAQHERLEEFVAFAGNIKLAFPINLAGLPFRIN